MFQFLSRWFLYGTGMLAMFYMMPGFCFPHENPTSGASSPTEVKTAGQETIPYNPTIPALMVGKELPESQWLDGHGKQVRLRPDPGRKTLLVFWAQGEPRLQEKLNDLRTLVEPYLSRQLNVIFIRLGSGTAATDPMDYEKLSFPGVSLEAPLGLDLPLYRVLKKIAGGNGNALPLMALLDQHSILRFTATEVFQLSPALKGILGKDISDNDWLIPLQRKMSECPAAAYEVFFNPPWVKNTLEKRSVKLPETLNGIFFGLTSIDHTAVLIRRGEKPDQALLTVDANRNDDLTDDATVTLPIDPENPYWETVPIRVSYSDGRTEPHEYMFSVREWPDQSQPPVVDYSYSVYFEGYIELEGAPFQFSVSDPGWDGRIDGTDSRNNRVAMVLQPDGKSWKPLGYGLDLISLGNRDYAISQVAEDGSWLRLSPSRLKRVVRGEPAPGLTFRQTDGQTFRLANQRGKAVLLYFWYTRCQPCIEQWPNLKKVLEKYPSIRFSYIGINLDEAPRLDKARELIAKYAMPGPLVMDGQGFRVAALDQFGPLAESPMSVPLYVVVDPAGRICYVTNDHSNAERVLDNLLASDPRQRERPVVQLRIDYQTKSLSSPVLVSFDPDTVKRLRHPQVLPSTEVEPPTRLGVMPNGLLVLSRPAAEAHTVELRVDTNTDGNFESEAVLKLPVLQTKTPAVEQTTQAGIMFRYEKTTQFLRYRFFAFQPAGESSIPEIYYLGVNRRFFGQISIGSDSYRVELRDPTADCYFTPDDIRQPGILSLAEKKGDQYVPISSDDGYLLGGRKYRLHFVSLSGNLLELAPME